MIKRQITNIEKQILMEKGIFIYKNSRFFHKNLLNDDIIGSLKNILVDPAPLTQCPDYEDLINDIKNMKIKNVDELSYGYSFETLFAIINAIRNGKNISETSRLNQIEALRLYVRYIPEQANSKMYYSSQKLVTVDKEKADSIVEDDRQMVIKRRNH